MEGKELYGNEDEDLNPKSKKEEEDAEDFGLPEDEDSHTDDKADELEDPISEGWEENKEEEESIVYSETTDEVFEEDDESEQEAVFEKEMDHTQSSDDEDEYRSSYYEEDYNKKKSPIGWIIFAILIIIAIIIGGFWWMNRDVEPDLSKVSETPMPVIEQPVQEAEPEVVEVEPDVMVDDQPMNTGAGVFEINEPTGRYHVIVACAIDVDLLTDYANKLAKDGMTCNILAPSGKRLFYRLSVADYVSLDDATIKSEESKSTFGEDVWVIRY